MEDVLWLLWEVERMKWRWLTLCINTMMIFEILLVIYERLMRLSKTAYFLQRKN